MAERSRPGLVVPLALLAGAGLLVVPPLSAGAVRLAGVSLLWWYAGLTTLVAGALVARRRSEAARATPLAISGSPVLLVTLGALVFAGGVGAPLLVLTAALAPLVADLGPRRPALPYPAAGCVVTLCASLLVGANLLVAGDVAPALGLPRPAGLAAAALLALAGAAAGGGRWPVRAAALGVGGLLAVVASVAAAVGITPWAAWTEVASRVRLTFDDDSRWVREGGELREPTTLTLREAQRVTAVAAATWRVVEREHDRTRTRDRRLDAGDSLALRAGDQLVLPAGARVRFEPGRAVPGARPSGIAWADPAAVGPLARLAVMAGAAATLLGGAAVMVTRSGRARPAALVALPAAVAPLVVAVWGVYAAHAAPDLALGLSEAGAFVMLPGAAIEGRWGAAVGGVAVAALAALIAAAVAGLGDLAGQAWRPTGRSRMLPARLAIVVLGGLLALGASDPWRLLLLGCGLAAATLATAAAVEGPAARVAAALTGGAAFVGLALAAPRVAAVAPVLADYPALLAIPLGWTAGRLVAAQQ